LAVSATIASSSGWAVNDAIRSAARATGTSFEYLLATAKVESDFNPRASASTSSARGLFQFIDQTWLGTLKQEGPRLGYSLYADAISRTASGRYEVTDPEMRRKIMALRDDPAANAAMAGAFTQRNASRLAGRLGRTATDAELYVAHFLGSAGATRLITLAAASPNAIAADVFPKAANANRAIFYENGRARTAAEVYAALVRRYEVARGQTMTPAAVAENGGGDFQRRAPAAIFETSTYAGASATNATGAPVFHGLFRSESNGVSQFIQELWTARPRIAAALSGASGTTPAASGPNQRSHRPHDSGRSTDRQGSNGRS
jgi:hypothetical protein